LRNGEADMALLQQISPESPICERALSLPGSATRDRLTKRAVHYVMKLPSSIDGGGDGPSSGHCSELRRKRKKIRRNILKDFDGHIKVECFREPAELEGTIAKLEPIAAKSYQRGLGVGFQDTEQMRRRLQLCAEKGWLRIYLLTLKDKPCAFWVGTVYNGTFCSDHIGFDPQFGNYSPGMFLLTEMIEDFCKAGIREIDFGQGGGLYKERFGNSQSTEVSVCVFAPTWKGISVNAARTATGLVEHAIRKILEHTNLLPRIKRFWRMRIRHATRSV
jgi:hypothetical protein